MYHQGLAIDSLIKGDLQMAGFCICAILGAETCSAQAHAYRAAICTMEEEGRDEVRDWISSRYPEYNDQRMVEEIARGHFRQAIISILWSYNGTLQSKKKVSK